MVDFSRLEKSLGNDTVLGVYAVTALHTCVKIYDGEVRRRVKHLSFSRKVVLVIDSKKNVFVPSSPAAFSPLDSERFLYAASESSRVAMSDSPLGALDVLLRLQVELREEYKDVLVDMVHSPGVINAALSERVLIAVHLGASYRSATSKSNRKDIFSNWFKCSAVGIFGQGCETKPSRTILLTCDSERWMAYEVVGDAAAAVATSCFQAEKTKRDGGIVRGDSPPEADAASLSPPHKQPSAPGLLNLEDYSDEDEDEFYYQPDADDHHDCSRKRKADGRIPCNCDICLAAWEKYGAYTKVAASQKKLITRPDIIELVTFFGLDTPDTMSRLSRAFTLSIGAFDVESLSVVDERVRVEAVSEVRGSNHLVGVQIAALLGFAWRLDGDGFEYSVYDMCDKDRDGMEAFIRDMLSAAEKLRAEKEELLAPLFDRLEEVRRRHFQFFKAKGLTKEEAAESYSLTLFCKLHNLLVDLTKRLIVWAFNGQSYDIPLTLKRASIVAMEKFGLKVKVSGARGNYLRHSKVRFGDSVMWACVSKMLSPGLSLQKFCDMTGLNMSKMYFPFDLIRAPSDLERKTLPPEDDECWFSSLTQTRMPLEHIRQAHSDFARTRSESVGQYLKSYLRVDCHILLKACDAWFRMLQENFNSHCVDCLKLSISSYSFHVVSRHLGTRKAPSQMLTTSLPTYYGCKESAVGGLSTVFCHRGVVEPGNGEYGGVVGGRRSSAPEDAAVSAPTAEELHGTLGIDINSLYLFSSK